MTRHAALVVAALGRSPYVDEVVSSSDHHDTDPPQPSSHGSNRENQRIRYVQRYDSRGHPINHETRHRERMEVLAGNEVLQAAGIVETFSAREKRERTEEEEKEEERFNGKLCDEVGHALLTVGTWAVSGVRRRVMLYESYSNISFFHILRQERRHYGIANLVRPGLLAANLSLVVGLKWRHFEYVISRRKAKTFTSKLLVSLVKLCSYGITYATTYTQMYALVRQLNLIEPGAPLLPPIRSIIPLSQDSLIQFPSTESDDSSKSMSRIVLSKASSLVKTALPIALVYAYGAIVSSLSTHLFNGCYKLVLGPAITPSKEPTSSSSSVWAESLTTQAFLQALRNNGFAPMTHRPLPEAREYQESHAIRSLLHYRSQPFHELRDQSATIHRNEALRILEGGANNNNNDSPSTDLANENTPGNDWETGTAHANVNAVTGYDAEDPAAAAGDDAEPVQVSWASMISVEVVDHGPEDATHNGLPASMTATDPPDASAPATGPGAATAASSSRHPATAPKPEHFHVTLLTMLPTLLLARTMSMCLARTIAIPLEFLMIRSVARSYVQQHPRVSPPNLFFGGWQYAGWRYGAGRPGFKAMAVFACNLLYGQVLLVAVGGVVWFGVSRLSVWLRSERVGSERGPVEIEIGEAYY